MELWTERQATEYLQRHPLTGRDAARSALKAGIAGAPVQVRSALLYDADRVREAFERTYDPCRIRERTDRPIFVARVAPRTPDPNTSWRGWRGADALAPMEEQRDAARAWWHLGARMWALVGGVGEVKGMPFVVTCGGFIVLGAELRGIDGALAPEGATISRARRATAKHAYSRRACAFVLDDPGPWFDGQYGKRWSTGPGGPFRVFLGNGRLRPRLGA
jgi:hypothetical protein